MLFVKQLVPSSFISVDVYNTVREGVKTCSEGGEVLSVDPQSENVGRKVNIFTFLQQALKP